jgi:hypothetical protein
MVRALRRAGRVILKRDLDCSRHDMMKFFRPLTMAIKKAFSRFEAIFLTHVMVLTKLSTKIDPLS